MNHWFASTLCFRQKPHLYLNFPVPQVCNAENRIALSAVGSHLYSNALNEIWGLAVRITQRSCRATRARVLLLVLMMMYTHGTRLCKQTGVNWSYMVGSYRRVSSSSYMMYLPRVRLVCIVIVAKWCPLFCWQDQILLASATFPHRQLRRTIYLDTVASGPGPYPFVSTLPLTRTLF